MSATQFADLQEALLFAFGPLIGWGLVFLAVGGILGGFAVMWLGLLRWLSRKNP